MDRKRYIPGDEILHPGTGVMQSYQDVNDAVFQEVSHDAYGNRFTHNHALNPAERYGYSYVGGGSRHRRRHSVPTMASPAVGFSNEGVAAPSAVNIGYITSAREEGTDDGFVLIVLLVLFIVALLPLGAAILVRRAAARRSVSAEATVVTLMLAEPAWLLLLWHWFWGHAWWPAAVALLLPGGFAAIRIMVARRR